MHRARGGQEENDESAGPAIVVGRCQKTEARSAKATFVKAERRRRSRQRRRKVPRIEAEISHSVGSDLTTLDRMWRRGDEREGCENARSSVETERPLSPTSAEAARMPDRPEDEARVRPMDEDD